MKLAERVTNVQPSPTLAVDARANAMRAQGIDVINFGVGQPDFETPVHVRQAAKDAIDKGYTRYTPVDGIPELKKAIVEKFKHDNKLEYALSQVSVNVGGKHSCYLLCQALLNPGDEVIIPAPYWVSFPAMVTLAGGVPVLLPSRQENGFKLTLEDLQAAISPRSRAIIINSPSNPTGTVYNKEELTPLAELAIRQGLIIFSDEIYSSILFDNRTFTSVAALSPDIYNHTVTLNGVSKTYAMTGWRIGYMAGPEDLIKACNKIQSQSTSNPTSISQWASLAALTGPQDEVAANCREFQKRRDYIIKRLLAIPQVTCSTPGGAFYVFPNFSAYYGKKFQSQIIKNSLDLTSYLLDQAQVAVVPGVAFGEDSCLRFSYAVNIEQIETAMNRLDKALAQLK
ncbi:MAG: pyridoxal phosphate-dependent aminotransferase [Desulfarculales bacterium]|jgi:aspartate aminotransferase|nr:pyridoxal phosphate-dependent aminotransferase [Desulfarculales bacterium]